MLLTVSRLQVVSSTTTMITENKYWGNFFNAAFVVVGGVGLEMA